MSLIQFLLILIARRAIVLRTFMVFLIMGILLIIVLPKSYKAQTDVVLNYKGNDPVTGLSIPPQLMPGYMATQVDIISSHNTSLRVVDKLKIAENQQSLNTFFDIGQGGLFHINQKEQKNPKDWAADKLLKRLIVEPSRESSVISISYKGSNPENAAKVANAFAEAYQELSVLIKIDPAKKASSTLDSQANTLREGLRSAQARLSKYKQDEGLTGESANNLDVESARLNDLSSQLVSVQSQLIEAKSRKESISKNGETSPDVAADPVVQSIKNQLASAESKLSNLSQNIGPNHPQYQAAKLEIDKLKTQLKDATQAALMTIGGSAQINKQREHDLQMALATQKTRVLKLNLSRGELAVLQGDVDDAQKALDDVTQRLSQNKLEGNVNQSDVSILNAAIPPETPSRLRNVIIMLISILIGIVSGISLSFLFEFLDRRVRSPGDVAQIIDTTLLVVIQSESQIKNRKFFYNITRKLSKIA